MPHARFANMTPTDSPIYNVWDDECEHTDAWTYNLAAALRFARFAARKNGATYHVAAYVEYTDRDGCVHTDFHSNQAVLTATPN
jgi:hypothetical protein